MINGDPSHGIWCKPDFAKLAPNMLTIRAIFTSALAKVASEFTRDEFALKNYTKCSSFDRKVGTEVAKRVSYRTIEFANGGCT